MLFVAGGNLLFKREQLKPEQVEAARITADLILEAYRRMDCAALNVGAYDLSLGIDYLLEMRRQHSIPFVSANLVHRHEGLFFPPYVMREVGGVRVGVFGLVSPGLKLDKIPDAYKLSVKDPYETAASVVAELQRRGAEYVVLLTDMEGRELRRIAQMDLGVDLIVGSSKRNKLSLPVVAGDTFLVHLDRGGKSVGRLDLTFPPAGEGPSLLDRVGFRGQRIRNIVYVHNFVQLRVEIPDHPEIAALVAAAKKRIAEAQRKGIAEALPSETGGCGKEYVGAQACQRCHPRRHKNWAATEHARAYEALVRENRQYDEECIVCHVLAYECDQGVVNLKSIANFANVQCESCHGPGDLHVQSGGKQPMVVDGDPARICAKCHTPEKSEGSDFASRLRHVCSDGG
ncbi:MAG: hypothetical protein Kow0092_13740 [Deferrisomatales bacterium]